MYLRRKWVFQGGKRRAYWALVESVRTARGPRQRVLAWLGQEPASRRDGIFSAMARWWQTADRLSSSTTLFSENTEPEWLEIDATRVRLENAQSFGPSWLGLKLVQLLGLDTFLQRTLPEGREEISWCQMALLLILCRFISPSSELKIAEGLFEKHALGELLGIPADKVNDDRLYRALDVLLPHKESLEKHLKERAGELFDLQYDLFLYDITSTYFEGEAKANPQAQRGYSRDQRPDCKQVCIGLVVSREGFPLGYEVFAGNTQDGTTLTGMVEQLETRYGKADRIWVMDRGFASDENFEMLKSGGRRYLIGAPRQTLRKFQKELTEDGWQQVQHGVEAKIVPSPEGEEVFILCRSEKRKDKDRAITERFEHRLEEHLAKIRARCEKQTCQVGKIERQIGRLLERNSRASALFEIEVKARDDGSAQVCWKKKEALRDWVTLSEGCYLLRSNIQAWSPEELWRAYIQLTQAEDAFRIQKSDLTLRPVWHQKEERVRAHILVCFLAFVLWKTLEGVCRKAGLGNAPRKVLEELESLQIIDVILTVKPPSEKGTVQPDKVRTVEVRTRCLTTPTPHQKILLHHLGLTLPKRINLKKM